MDNQNKMQKLKVFRIFTIYERLLLGETLNKSKVAEQLGVNEKTIQRDIADLNAFLADSLINPRATIEYDYGAKGYTIRKDQFHWLEEKEVLAILKVLLESRAFLESEMNTILEKLIELCEQGAKKKVLDIIRNESYHYTAIQNSKPLFQSIWDLSEASRSKRLVEMIYKKEKHDNPKNHLVQPVGIIFSDFYFYLIAYINHRDFEYPAIYRLDRIQSYKVTHHHFKTSQRKRFEEGEFRKRVQFMKAGQLLKVRFLFWGPSPEAVLDRLPTAKMVSLENGKVLFEAEVYGKGIIMWFLSQAQFLEVISPLELRNEMRNTIRQMNDLYKE